MTANLFLRCALTAGFLFGVSSVALAQQDTQTETPATTPPSRPVVLPMTPGAELKKQEPTTVTKPTTTTPKPRSTKPRIIPVPGGSDEQPTPAATSTQAAKPEKAPTSDYTFCNRTSYAVSVAVGIRNGGLWATRGWWIIPAGECKVVIKGPLTQTSYFSFARSSFAHTGPIRTWGGTQTLCTGKGNFQATSDGSNQCGPGYEPQGFAKIDTDRRAAWRTVLAEATPYKNDEQARIAGLQRLLFDLGRFDGPIDGVAGPKFSQSLSDARTAFAIAPADAAALYNKLLAEAAKIQAGAGFTLCNRTQDIVWTALGLDSQGKKQSMGWWRLQPGQCEKVIKDRLVDRYIYTFAAADRSEGLAETWTGPKQFCTRDSGFEIEDVTDCQGRGFNSTGFLEIDTGGRPGITFEFAPRGSAAAPAQQ